MYVYESTILNSTYDYSTTSDTSSTEMDKEDFLTVFIAQLENQDPLNPVDNSEMIAQLAEFSSLEQLTNMNDTMETLAEDLSALNVTSAVSFLGKEVVASGNSVSLAEGSAGEVTYELETDAAALSVDVYNSDGEIVFSQDLGAQAAGEYEYQWSGLDDGGEACAGGIYYVKFTAEDEYGEGVDVSTSTEGLVTGLTSSGGSTVLELEDGRQVNLLSVTKVSQPAETASE